MCITANVFTLLRYIEKYIFKNWTGSIRFVILDDFSYGRRNSTQWLALSASVGFSYTLGHDFNGGILLDFISFATDFKQPKDLFLSCY